MQRKAENGSEDGNQVYADRGKRKRKHDLERLTPEPHAFQLGVFGNIARNTHHRAVHHNNVRAQPRPDTEYIDERPHLLRTRTQPKRLKPERREKHFDRTEVRMKQIAEADRKHADRDDRRQIEAHAEVFFHRHFFVKSVCRDERNGKNDDIDRDRMQRIQENLMLFGIRIADSEDIIAEHFRVARKAVPFVFARSHVKPLKGENHGIERNIHPKDEEIQKRYDNQRCDKDVRLEFRLFIERHFVGIVILLYPFFRLFFDEKGRIGRDLFRLLRQLT